MFPRKVKERLRFRRRDEEPNQAVVRRTTGNQPQHHAEFLTLSVIMAFTD
ncbi:MAG: hypothetical protein K1X90_01670 [Candidatus Kapabacteria bacterium]|nr:hypothetical protein [Candidatus Kapabacteria bacterium]